MGNSRIAWIAPGDPPDAFPPVETALSEPDGLLAAGGDLGTERLLWAYRHGIFPWYEDGQPLLWWSPDPRCLFEAGDLRVSNRLRRAIRNSGAELRTNTAFAKVIRACAGPRRHQSGTWITGEMIDAYERLHARGWAHSIEVWHEQELVGGLYGIAIGTIFFGESMFSATPNASKIALLYLSRRLDSGALTLVDCQVISQHLLSLGARTLPRQSFLEKIRAGTTPAVRIENWPQAPISAARLLPE